MFYEQVSFLTSRFISDILKEYAAEKRRLEARRELAFEHSNSITSANLAEETQGEQLLEQLILNETIINFSNFRSVINSVNNLPVEAIQAVNDIADQVGPRCSLYEISYKNRNLSHEVGLIDVYSELFSWLNADTRPSMRIKEIIEVGPEKPMSLHLKKNYDDLIVKKNLKYKEEVRNSLRKTHFFQVLDDVQLDEALEAMIEIRINSGDVMIDFDEPIDKFYVLVDGLIEIRYKPNVTKKIHLYQKFDTFKETALLYDEPSEELLTALIESRLWIMTQADYRRIVLETGKPKETNTIRVLKSVTLFRNLRQEQYKSLSYLVEPFMFKRGSCVFREGHEASGG